MPKDITAILILTYNDSTNTINCIRSIENCNSAPIKFIVVDNGSSDTVNIGKLDAFFSNSGFSYHRWNDSDLPKEELPYYSFFVSRCNDGYAQGNNKGLRLTYEDPTISHVLILNNDILFTEDIIPTLLDFQRQHSDCGLVTPLIVSKKGTIDHCCARLIPTNWEIIRLFGYFGRDFHHRLSRDNKRQKILLNNPELITQASFPVDVPSGACMLIDKELFRRIGGFDPDTFLYYEENILYKKLLTVSRTNHCVPSVKCTHLGAGSTQNQNSHFLQRCNLESADVYLSRYGQLSLFQQLTWKMVKMLWRLKFKLIGTSFNN
ncbi:MAG: hypothetical protein IKM93_04030 [Bacteroidales bacterium]|nr:hypothetical protein [Bacteroidales bacterium]